MSSSPAALDHQSHDPRKNIDAFTRHQKPCQTLLKFPDPNPPAHASAANNVRLLPPTSAGSPDAARCLATATGGRIFSLLGVFETSRGLLRRVEDPNASLTLGRALIGVSLWAAGAWYEMRELLDAPLLPRER